MRHYDTYFPVALRLAGKRVVIVGGDNEAEMKVEKLLPTSARIEVIAEQVTERIAQRAATSEIHHLRRPYKRGDLANAAMAIVCDPAYAQLAREEAEERNVLLNVLDQTELCDFIAVAYFSRDGLQVAVHSSGKSAALSRRLRERFEHQLGKEYSVLVRALGELRDEVAELIPGSKERREFWLDRVDAALLERIDRAQSHTEHFDVERLKEELLAHAAGFLRPHVESLDQKQ